MLDEPIKQGKLLLLQKVGGARVCAYLLRKVGGARITAQVTGMGFGNETMIADSAHSK